MRFLRWLTERPLSQAEANAKLRALMAKRLRNHPDYRPRYREGWDEPTEKVRPRPSFLDRFTLRRTA